MKKTDVLVLVFLILSSVFVLKDLFLPGMYTSHDGPHQVVRAYYYHEALSEGQIPPRYVGLLNFGFGYPLFIFSYHLPWLIAEPFRLFGFSIFTSIKMTYLLGFILSGIFMYLYQRYLFGRFAAFVGTIIYLYAPFRFSNIFVRSAIGDATAFIFAPLLFWSFDLLYKKATFKRIVFTALSLSALLLSHAMVFFLYILGLGLFAVFRLITGKKKILFILAGIGAVILFILFSSFYLLPSFFERSFTKFPQLMGSAGVIMHFAPFKKLLYSPWGYGTVDAVEGSMSLSIGFAQMAAFVLSIAFVFKRLFKKSYRNSFFSDYGLIFSLIFLLSVFFMTPASALVWKFISRYVLIDFNWRILNLTVFSASILSGWLFFQFKKRKLLQFLFAFILIVVAFYTNRNHLRINQSLDWSVPFFLKLEKTTNSFDEYNPLWADTGVIKENSPRLVFSSDFSYKILEEKNNRMGYAVDAKDDGQLTVNTLYYPGWTVYDGERKIDFSFDGDGLIKFPLKKGKHQIITRFENTPLRKTADLISLATFIIIGMYFLKKKYYG